MSYSLSGDSIPQSIVVADVNGDGHPDIIIGGSAEVDVLLQDASAPGTFLAGASYATANATQIAIADVNGDGLLDIVVPVGISHPLSSGVYTNNPGVFLQIAGHPGTFSAEQDLPQACVALDVAELSHPGPRERAAPQSIANANSYR